MACKTRRGLRELEKRLTHDRPVNYNFRFFNYQLTHNGLSTQSKAEVIIQLLHPTHQHKFFLKNRNITFFIFILCCFKKTFYFLLFPGRKLHQKRLESGKTKTHAHFFVPHAFFLYLQSIIMFFQANTNIFSVKVINGIVWLLLLFYTHSMVFFIFPIIEFISWRALFFTTEFLE